MKITTHTLQETLALGRQIGTLLAKGTTILLHGDLGAGKTALTKGIAQGLAVNATVNSPTFTIVKVYQGRLPLYHIDAYRLSNRTDDIGLEDLIFDEGVTVIEWPEYAKQWIPSSYLSISITYIDETSREFVIDAVGDLYRKLLEDLAHA